MSIFDDVEGLTDEIKAALAEKVTANYVAKADFDAVNKKKEELLTETKAAKSKAAQAELDAKEAKAANEGAESLKKFYEEEKKKLAEELDSIKQQTKKQQIASLANKFVSEKFDSDPVVSEAIMAKFANRIDIREGKTMVLDNDGNITGLSVEDLQNEFLSSDRYKKHIIASRASGGGATGSKNSGGAAKQMARSAFESMNPQEKMDFIKGGGKVT